MKAIATICVILCAAPAICVADETFRCGNSLVTAEVSVSELLSKCGKPTSQKASQEDVRNEHGVVIGTSTTEVWRYDRGSMAAAMIVTIVDGKIQSMESGK